MTVVAPVSLLVVVIIVLSFGASLAFLLSFTSTDYSVLLVSLKDTF